MVEFKTFDEFQVWLLSQPSSVHSLVLKLSNDPKLVSDFESWANEFEIEYESTDWTQYQSSFGTVEYIEWKQKSFSEIKMWLAESKDYRKTVETWVAVYIQCGTCYRGFLAWLDECEIGPEDDLPGWIESAVQIVTEKRWI